MRVKKLLAKSIVAGALSICMAAGCMVTAEAAPYTEPCVADVKNNGDGTFDIILKGDEDGTDVNTFDYGLVYDNTKVSVEKIEWDSSFKAEYTKNDKGVVAEGDLGTYVVVGGTYYKEEYMVEKDQKIVVVTFKVKDGENPGEILLTDDSAQYDKDFTDATGVILALPEEGLSRVLSYGAGVVHTSEQLYKESVAGDANGDFQISLEDAQLVLKAALKISSMRVKAVADVDVNKDNQVDLTDAQWILKAALKITTIEEMQNRI